MMKEICCIIARNVGKRGEMDSYTAEFVRDSEKMRGGVQIHRQKFATFLLLE